MGKHACVTHQNFMQWICYLSCVYVFSSLSDLVSNQCCSSRSVYWLNVCPQEFLKKLKKKWRK
uniref:Uncharacterized protein n=1 Tax=Rhizophora mucronata TaxID=61149 RepID=A0A2P2IVW1_RHIMU